MFVDFADWYNLSDKRAKTSIDKSAEVQTNIWRNERTDRKTVRQTKYHANVKKNFFLFFFALYDQLMKGWFSVHVDEDYRWSKKEEGSSVFVRST